MAFRKNNSRKQRRKRRRRDILISIVCAPLVAFGGFFLLDRAFLMHAEGITTFGTIAEIRTERCGGGRYWALCRRYKLSLHGERMHLTSSQVAREFLSVPVGRVVPVTYVPDRIRAVYVGEKPSTPLGYFRVLEVLLIVAGFLWPALTVYFVILELADTNKRRKFRLAKQTKRNLA